MQSCLWFTDVCMAQGEWAAWTQAIFSVLAIIAAGLFPIFQENRRTRQRIDTYAAMVRTAFANASRDARTIEKGVGGVSASHWQATKWDRIRDAFAAIPYHDLPDYQLFNILHDAAEAVTNFQSLWRECIATANLNYPINEATSLRAEGLRVILQDLHEEALQVALTYSGFPVWRWIKRQWFLIKLRRAVKNARKAG